MHFWEIICALAGNVFCSDLCSYISYIVYVFCRYTHIRNNRGQGAMTLKGGSKRPSAAVPPKAPKNGTKSTYSSI